MGDEEKKPSKLIVFIRWLFLVALVACACGVGGYIAVCYLEEPRGLRWDPALLQNNTFLSISVAAFALIAFFYLINFTDRKKKDTSGAKLKTKDGLKKYYDTHWLTEKELTTDKAFKYHLYSDLKNTDDLGIPIRAELRGKQLNVNMYKSIHTLVIGTTGSGKTTQFVDPVMQIMSESHAKPCFVVTDPKGEIYDHHSEKLRKQGYRVLVFDLKDPFLSTRWNPMDRAFMLNQRAVNLINEVVTHHNDDPRKFNVKCVSHEYYSEWYEFDGFAFADKASLQSHINSVKQKLQNEAFEDLRDIAATLCPIQSNNDPIWERGAKDLILGTMLAMLEDSENPALGMTREKFNFFNLSKILNLKDNDAYNPLRSITEYFQGRSPLSKATQLANQVVTNAEKTTKSYMGIVTDRMGIFSDTGVCYATSYNDMELETFADRPTALFIKIPDEKTTRHPIATMFVSQLYKILVDVANKRGGALSRDVYFVLDEFGNMPKIENFETIITVARSRRIYFMLILQSYAQLDIKYGTEVSSTVKDNCNIHIFIASNDANTLEEFSKKCGNITVETENTTISKGKKEDGESKTTSLSQESRPLIYPAELASLKPNSGECIVYILQQSPIKSIFTPSYKCNQYDMRKAPPSYALPKALSEEEIYYDIKKRNQIILRANKPNPLNNAPGNPRGVPPIGF